MTRGHGGIFLVFMPGDRHVELGQFRAAVSYFFAETPSTQAINRKMRTKPRLPSCFCLFCGAKQANTSPVRHLSTLNSAFLGFKAAKRLVPMAQKGAVELMFGVRREQKAAFPPCPRAPGQRAYGGGYNERNGTKEKRGHQTNQRTWM